MPKVIMVVDDDATTRNLVRLILERKGFRIVEADDGQAALRSLESMTPDLLILDIMMPGMDGYELCRRLRARAETEMTPILMFSATEERKALPACLAAGANDYLAKTSPPPILLQRVQQLLEPPAPLTQ